MNTQPPIDMAKPKALYALIDTFVVELLEHYDKKEIFSALMAYATSMVKPDGWSELIKLLKVLGDHYEADRRTRKS